MFEWMPMLAQEKLHGLAMLLAAMTVVVAVAAIYTWLLAVTGETKFAEFDVISSYAQPSQNPPPM